MTDELTPEMQAHIELTRAQASHNYVPQQRTEVKRRRRVVQPEVLPVEEVDGDHGDSA